MGEWFTYILECSDKTFYIGTNHMQNNIPILGIITLVSKMFLLLFKIVSLQHGIY